MERRRRGSGEGNHLSYHVAETSLRLFAAYKYDITTGTHSIIFAVCSGVVMPSGNSRMRMLRKWISLPSDSRHR